MIVEPVHAKFIEYGLFKKFSPVSRIVFSFSEGNFFRQIVYTRSYIRLGTFHRFRRSY